MKSASQWAIQEKKTDYIPTEGDLEHFAKKVQADALRHAASLLYSDYWNDSDMEAVYKRLGDEADNLEL